MDGVTDAPHLLGQRALHNPASPPPGRPTVPAGHELQPPVSHDNPKSLQKSMKITNRSQKYAISPIPQ